MTQRKMLLKETISPMDYPEYLLQDFFNHVTPKENEQLEFDFGDEY